MAAAADKRTERKCRRVTDGQIRQMDSVCVYVCVCAAAEMSTPVTFARHSRWNISVTR